MKVKKASDLEDSFALWLMVEGMPPCAPEHQFHWARKWRFDFAWPQHKVAVEVDGMVYGEKKGGHQTVKGRLEDAEKYMAAQRLGWQILTVPGPWILEGERDIWRPEVMETLRALLNASTIGS